MTTPAFRLQQAAWRTLQAVRGESIVYHVHTTLAIPIALAVLTQPATGRVDVTESVGFESRRWNWLIDPLDLVDSNGASVEPRHGHWIMRGTTKFILTPNDKNLVWRWSDAGHIWRRVFCEEA